MSDGIATVAAALIGAGIAIVGLVISKEGKVSEFRQQWIDGLRADVSSFIATAAAMQVRPIETASHFRDLTLRLKEVECRIELRFKKDDPDSEKLLDLVRDIVDNADLFGPAVGFEKRLKELTEATQETLQLEWKRVKLGEDIYQKTLKYAKFAAIALSLTLSVWFFVSFVLLPLITCLPGLFKG